MTNYKHSEVTDVVIRAFYNVYNQLGHGFLEKVYENAMGVELKKMRLVVETQVPIDVFYDSHKVGKYYADILVEGVVIVELKAAESIVAKHEAQLLNYLKATKVEVGLLLNFGQKPQVKRKLFDNHLK